MTIKIGLASANIKNMYKNIFKYTSLSILLAIFLYIILIRKVPVTNNSSNTSDERVTPLPTPSLIESEIDNYNVIVDNITTYKLTPVPNFEKEFTSLSIKEKYNCDVLVNGGFYDEQGKPLGTYFLNSKKYSEVKKNSFVNGIFSLDTNGQMEISKVDLFDFTKDYEFYMQSGPLYIISGTIASTDKGNTNARRIIIADDLNNNFYIIVIVDKNNFNSGPNISEASDILLKLKETLNLDIQSAINLDGGNASLFISENYSITESTFAGSFLCFIHQ